MKYRRETEHDDSNSPLVVHDELAERGVIVAHRLLDLPHGPVHLSRRNRAVDAVDVNCSTMHPSMATR